LLILAGVIGLLIHCIHIYNVPDGDWGIAILSPISFTYCSTHGGFGRKVEIVRRPGCNFYPSPHAMGCGASRSLRYDPGFFSFSREVLATGTKEGQISKYFLTREAARAICNRSKIIEDTVYVYPLYAVVDGFDADAIAVSEDGGDFVARRIPRFRHPPYIFDENNIYQGPTWHIKKIEFLTPTSVVLSQVGSEPDANYYGDCPDATHCPIYIERRMQTNDAAKTWQLLDYKLLRPELVPKKMRIVATPVRMEQLPSGPLKLIE
jgi:hypothetical protein